MDFYSTATSRANTDAAWMSPWGSMGCLGLNPPCWNFMPAGAAVTSTGAPCCALLRLSGKLSSFLEAPARARCGFHAAWRFWCYYPFDKVPHFESETFVFFPMTTYSNKGTDLWGLSAQACMHIESALCQKVSWLPGKLLPFCTYKQNVLFSWR